MANIDRDIHDELLTELRKQYIEAEARRLAARSAYMDAIRESPLQQLADLLSPANPRSDRVYEWELKKDNRRESDKWEPICEAEIHFQDETWVVQVLGVCQSKHYPFEIQLYFRRRIKNGKWGKHMYVEDCGWMIEDKRINRHEA
jgi:hypothetical protein